jgi:hypothetical protein
VKTLEPIGWRVLVIVLLCGVWLGLCRLAYGAAPEGADPALAPWYRSLRNPTRHFQCCDLSDCRPTDWRWAAGEVQAWVGDQFGMRPGLWVEVPAESIIRQRDNLEGRAVLCWKPSFGVLCFVPGPET